jgi:glucosamine--fructose-6-phosphate aminotransferase (isomerizing)
VRTASCACAATRSLPADAVRDPPCGRRIRRILVIGQGTAAVAGQAVAAAIADALLRAASPSQAMPATELSGFAMRDDMRDTLIVAISQSGTTTDTNRTVDLVRNAAPPCSRSSIAAAATCATRPTACSTRATAATSR